MKSKSLITVKFPNSTTRELKTIGSMFLNCISLLSVDLSHFDTSKVTNLDTMFKNCISLTSINISNFDSSKVVWMYLMFEGCSNLEYINFKNAKDNKESTCNYNDIFEGTPDNLVICINETNSPNLTELFKNKNENCSIIDCSENWKLNQKKINIGFEGCGTNCSNLYEFNGRCQETCEYGSFFDEKDLVKNVNVN